jgi:MaoC like domain
VSQDLHATFLKRPSTIAYMARAFLPSPGLKRTRGFPPIRVIWKNARVGRQELSSFLRLTGLRLGQGMPLLFPHVFGFRLQMALLTHPAFPMPVWGALQIRNHLLQHRPIQADDSLELETRVAGQRILEKGAEVDLYTAVRSENELAWESLTTFYYRGRFGEQGAPSPLARPPEITGEEIARWQATGGSGWRFGDLTGDFNGIHWSSWYARAFGFRRAFHHPQRVLGQCLARLQATGTTVTQRLDAWLKGPVYYDSEVALRTATGPQGIVCALFQDGEDRPAIIARWSAVNADNRLIDENDVPVPSPSD